MDLSFDVLFGVSCIVNMIEPCRKKICLRVLEQVRHKPAFLAARTSMRLDILYQELEIYNLVETTDYTIKVAKSKGADQSVQSRS